MLPASTGQSYPHRDTIADLYIRHLKKWEWPMDGRPEALLEQSEEGNLPWENEPPTK
jgi:hypothetical protein